MAEERCPICHSEINKWTDDPILTPKGLAGDEYKGIIHPNIKHIKELQDDKKQLEIDYEIPEKTEFTEITPLSLYINKKHIEELRESTEKILGMTGQETPYEKYSFLIPYFNRDSSGEYIGTYEYGKKIGDKFDFTDPILTENVKIKAIHIEDLRHPIYIPFWEETFENPGDDPEKPILDESGYWLIRGGYYALPTKNWEIPDIWGKYKWIMFGGLNAVMYSYGGYCEGSFDLKQIGSSLQYNFTTTAHCENENIGRAQIQFIAITSGSVGSYFRPQSKLELTGLSFTGTQGQCVIEIPITLTVKKLVSIDPLIYESAPDFQKKLYFYTQYGSPVKYNTMSYYYLKDGRLVYRQPFGVPLVECSLHYYPVGDKTIKIVDAMNYQWEKEYETMGESKTLNKEYVSRIYTGGFKIWVNAGASLSYSIGSKTTEHSFSLDNIKFTYLI